jgi:hypothetical protein
MNGFAKTADDLCVEISSTETAASDDPPHTSPPAERPALTELSPPRLLRRISLDLLGVLPTTADLDAVEADPKYVDVFAESALENPLWEERLVHIYGQSWHTQVDEFQLLYKEYDNLYRDSENEFPFERSAGEEPLRLLAHVAATGRPWTEILTADYTMANEVLASIWPIEHSGTGWQRSHYTDDRPPVGVLASNGMWLRYYSAGTNRNRGRAAAMTRLLICEDYLARPVSFANFPGLADESGTEKALQNEPYCLGCHSTIDPIAAALFGFDPADTHNGDETGWYHPEREPLGETKLQVSPAWFGHPVTGLLEMAHTIAADNRFRRCAVESMTESLWQRNIHHADLAEVQSLLVQFEDSGLRVGPLTQAIIGTQTYRAGGVKSDTDLAERENTARLLMPDQWNSLIKDLTGFSWTWAGFDQMSNDTYGYRVMSGGVDGLQVTRTQEVPSLTSILVAQRLSEAAARTALESSWEEGHGLLVGVDPTDRPGDDTFEDTLAELHWRLLARRPSEEDLDSLRSLWEAVQTSEDVETAWVAVLSALLRHPEFVSY